jgi:hypothetical protein
MNKHKLDIMLNKLSILTDCCLLVLRIMSRFYTLGLNCFGSPFRKNMCIFHKAKMHIDMEQNNIFLHHYSFVAENSRNPKILATMYQSINTVHFVNKPTLLSVRTAANLRTGLDELKNNCSTVIAGVSSRLVTPLSSVIALAASSMTISALLRRQDSRKSKKGRSPPWFAPDSLITCECHWLQML